MGETETTQLQEQVKTLFCIVGELKGDIKEIKEQLANRLPLWATIIISLLTGAVGWLLSKGG